MRKLFSFIFCLFALSVMAQVTTTPSVIPVGYTGSFKLTFDPTKGNAGMKDATACYAHMGYCTPTQNWLGVKGTWGTTNQPQFTKTSDGKWEFTIENMFTFFGVPETTNITKLVMVFHDGKGSASKQGKAAGDQDIFIILGEETPGDIWDDVEGVAPITGTRPSGIKNGINYGSDGTSVTLCTYAASRTEPAKRVFLLGDMTNWKLDAAHQMKRDGNYFWITLTGLEKGKEYRFQYAVERADGVKKQICDVYSEKVLHPYDQYEPKKVDPTLISYPERGADGGYVTVIQPGKPAYNWSSATTNFKRPNKDNLVIYELWVYDYTPTKTFEGVRQRLDYLQQLGVNAIELMPITEFDGNMSWGYNPALYFALDKAYGSQNMFKQLVDECHQRGMAVILDMVFNHTTGLNPMAKLYPWTSSSATQTELRFNPWFNVGSEVQHKDNDYGEDWNHTFEPAREMFTRCFQYWLTEYKVDGFRLDLSHGLCGRGEKSAVENLKYYYDNGVKAVASDAYMILEHWADDTSERGTLVNYGMMCWENTNNAYMEAAMGWLSGNDSFSNANKDGYVSYCESHDEERMQYKCKMYGNGAIKTNESTRLGRVAASVLLNVLLDGPHMIWQFEEIGYDFSINSDVSHPNATNDSYRCNQKPRPETYGYFRSPNRVEAYKKCAQAIQLRTKLHPEWFTGDPKSYQLGSGKAIRYVQWGDNAIAVANFDPSSAQSFSIDGTWYDFYTGGSCSGSVSLQAGEVKILTKTKVNAPTINLDLESLLPIENVDVNETPKATKILRDGQVLILRGDKTYNMQGQLVK